jgi:hypothetical protein
MINKWKIYYSDGSTFDWRQGDPLEAPPEGVICIVGYKSNGKRYITHGGAIDSPSKGYAQFYCFDIETEEWWGMDYAGLLDRLRRNLIYAFKEGRSVRDDLFQKIMHKAHTDPEFPQNG